MATSTISNIATIDRWVRGNKSGFRVTDTFGKSVLFSDGGKVRTILGVTDHQERIGKEAIDNLINNKADENSVKEFVDVVSTMGSITKTIEAYSL